RSPRAGCALIAVRCKCRCTCARAKLAVAAITSPPPSTRPCLISPWTVTGILCLLASSFRIPKKVSVWPNTPLPCATCAANIHRCRWSTPLIINTLSKSFEAGPEPTGVRAAAITPLLPRCLEHRHPDGDQVHDRCCNRGGVEVLVVAIIFGIAPWPFQPIDHCSPGVEQSTGCEQPD